MEQACDALTEEERMVARCLRGDAAAWQTLFQLYHPHLVIIIKSLIRNGSGAEQAEEIAAAVWSSLCSEEYARLRQYNPRAGRLLGYLAVLARRELWKSRRSERSRHSRECRVARKEAIWEEVGRGLALTEFLATLTSREREFCRSELLSQTEPMVHPSLTATNGWQLRCRVLKKFRTYFLRNDHIS
jgi:DNA-directed RNA polymerase specialized sigma24 family protein